MRSGAEPEADHIGGGRCGGRSRSGAVWQIRSGEADKAQRRRQIRGGGKGRSKTEEDQGRRQRQIRGG